jgi:two-component system sensor histidine kinase KdpD
MTNSIVLGWSYRLRRFRVLGQCFAAGVVIALPTYLGFKLRVDLTTISFVYLLLVVAMAMFCGFWQASFTSILAVACLDYFFTLPLFRFALSNSHDWAALGAFETTALAISRLSAKELRNAREAAIHRAGMKQLYELSRNSMLLDLHQPPGPQLVVLIHRIFGTVAVALFDMNLGRQDRVGDWGEGEEDIAKDCYLHNAAHDDQETETSQRILQAGPGSVGALVVRGQMGPLVVDALASLAAIAIDRYQSYEKEERAETASKSEQLRAAVMDALAHEFKSPLTAVQTASSGLFELGELSSSQRDLVTLIDGEVNRLNKLCTQLLLTAKLETEQIGLRTSEVNVKQLLDEVTSIRPEGELRNRIELDIEDPALTVNVDSALLAMILTQYVDNARKYSMPRTPIRVAVRMSHAEVLISVHNFGSTIQIEDRERIFDRFYRAQNVKNSVPGTGIGLSVVRKAAEAHHGHVWVISDDKEGTTFFLSLPTGARRMN